jgi:porphyrinogen peroxidase
VKAADSHLTLNTIVDEEGEQRQIVRYNMPFANIGAREFGTYFIGYARSPAVIEEMLTNMFMGRPAGNHDRILDFSTAVTGTLFFVPSADFLDDPPPAARPHVPSSEAASKDDPPSAQGGSLGIGDLRQA